MEDNKKNGTKRGQSNFFGNDSLMVQYIPAELKTNPSGWYVEFYFLNPLSGRLERSRIKVNYLRKKLKTDKAAKLELKLYCNKINMKLTEGWTPIMDSSAIGMKPLIVCIDDFLVMKKKEVRGETSYPSYVSQMNTFKAWLTNQKMEASLPCDFSKYHAMKYMDDVVLIKNISNRTWNNYRSFLRSFFNWMIERNYCINNHFSGMKKKRNEEKKRKTIPIEIRKEIVTYLQKEDYRFFIFILLEFSCLMRPVEIFRMKIGNIDIKNQLIRLSGNQTKNGKSRDIVIPNNVLNELIKYQGTINIDEYKETDYLFSINYLPGSEMQLSKVASRSWSNVRKALNLPMEYQLYSLRDSFITESMNAHISPLTIQGHADHSSLDMTSVYANTKSQEVTDDIRKNSPKFY